MCRLLLMNKQAEKEIERIYGLKKYLKYLENQLGGHGNGFALIKNKKIIQYDKGIKLSVKEIAQKIQSNDYDWAIFHTRLASVGSKCDENCHPFKRKQTIMAMNGTELSVNFLSKETNMTDTETILDIISKYNLDLDVLKNFNSIFVGFNNSKPFVVANNTTNIKILRNNLTKALAFASSFPDEFTNNIYETEKKFFWNGGKIPVKLKKYKKIYRRYYFPNDYYYDEDGQYYLYDEYEKKGA